MNDNPQILLVDDIESNLKALERPLTKEKYRLLTALDGQKALELVESEEVDLILLDVMMPGMSGFEVCRKLKQSPEHQLIPVVLVTALSQMEDRLKGIEAGADDFISKPFNRYELIARVRSLLRLKSVTDKLESLESVIYSLVQTIDARDAYTRGHAERVSSIAAQIGEKMGIEPVEVENIRKGGLLHDIGKIGIRDVILNKPGVLSKEERDIMKKHPQISYEICKPLKKAKGLLDLILHHHEKLDGSGYPFGLKGEKISLPARIIAVADIYDALLHDRAYRRALSREKTIIILEDEANEGHIDPEVVKCLKSLSLPKII